MKKTILTLMAVMAIANADTLVSVEGSAGKSHSSSTKEVKGLAGKLGYKNDSAALYTMVGIDHYADHEGSAKYYGFGFDKYFGDFVAGGFMAFGKKNMKGYEASIKDVGLKAGYSFGSVEAGVKYTDRKSNENGYRSRIPAIYVGYKF